ncbi:hypothetical protein J4Q44_G00038980, partial [Coregonus suidteri]
TIGTWSTYGQRGDSTQAKWALFFTRFNFTLSYHPGSNNIKADALSRLHDSGEVPVLSAPIIPPLRIVTPVLWEVDADIRQALERELAPTICPPARTYIPTEVAEALFQQVFRHYGLPEDIVSDRGPQFTSLMESLHGEAGSHGQPHIRVPASDQRAGRED